MSWKPQINDGSGWGSNALRFETKAEAEANAKDIFRRWTSAREWRVVECDDPPNYMWVDGSLKPYSVLAQSMLLDEQKGGKS